MAEMSTVYFCAARGTGLAAPHGALREAGLDVREVADGLLVRWDDGPALRIVLDTSPHVATEAAALATAAGQPVVAAGSGKVMYAGSGIRGYGNLVIVKHSNSLLSAYAHNRKIVVKEGDNVTKGQLIAEMGDSDADLVKLHFEIRQQGKPVDPTRFLPVR